MNKTLHFGDDPDYGPDPELFLKDLCLGRRLAVSDCIVLIIMRKTLFGKYVQAWVA